MNEIIYIILYGIFFGLITLMSLVFYSFIFIFPIFIIKIAIIINLKNKYNEELANKEFILEILKHSIIYKFLFPVLFQGIINFTFITFGFIFGLNAGIMNFGLILLTILFLFLSYKSLYKKSKKIFKEKKFCIWYSILLMPSILITIILNIVLLLGASSFAVDIL
mgnify:FL=1